jgi:L-malate glycosyltransferase
LSNNVLQLIGSLNQGGSERQAVQLTRLLRESGTFPVYVATLDNNGPLRSELEQIGIQDVPEYRLSSFRDSNAVVQLRRFVRYLRTNNIELVHAHDFYTNIFGMVAATLAQVPVRIASRRESAVRVAKQRMVERGAYRLAHRVVANCEEVRQQLIRDEGLPPEKVVTLYNGLDMRRLVVESDVESRKLLAELKLPAEGSRRFITIVANMRAHFQGPNPLGLKDHPTFLRAAARVHQVVPEAAFVIAGEGELLEDTRALAAELGLERDVFFLGRCERVAQLLSVSDICVLSSSSEGFSNSILEYMAAGRPVVATDVGGAREAVVEGETGYLVPSGDDEALAERIIRLLRDPGRARLMGERGRSMVEEKFSSAAQLTRTHQLYEQLLTRSRNRKLVVEGLSREGI